MQLVNQTIGLLGGSFNPAHEGHVRVTLEALRRLKLDAAWWLVSPHNPLKNKKDLANYATRLTAAKQITKPYPHIQISDFESQHQLQYSVDTVAALQQQYPSTRFVWLMGADNLSSFHKWHKWYGFFTHLPIAVFDRAPFSHTSLRSMAAIRYRPYRLDESDAALLPYLDAPAWVYCHMRRHPTSSTKLRKMLGDRAFLGHNDGVDIR